MLAKCNVSDAASYLAKIVFQHRQYFLGTYASVEEAAEARKKAEEAINGEVISFYEKWSEKAAADPVWAKDMLSEKLGRETITRHTMRLSMR